MNNKKVIIFLLVSFIIIFAFTACNKDNNPAATEQPKITAEPTNTPVPTDTPEPTPPPTPKPTREPHSEEKPYYGSIVSENPVSAKLFSNEASDPNTVHLPEEIMADTILAWQFVATTHFDYVDILMCTWSQPNGAANFSIFKWNNDYTTTVSGEALYSKDIEKIADNSTVKFTFDEPLPPAEYVVVIQDNKGTKIGIYKVPYEGEKDYEFVKYYVNDSEVYEALPQGNIHYVNTPEIKFLKISEAF